MTVTENPRGADREAAIEHLLTRGVAEVVVREDLKAKLNGPRPLRIKYGVDPTRPDIHLGHYVCFRKLREFQDLGHQVVLVIGDWTAQIGDPSGRSVQRTMLTADEVRENAQTYFDQFFKVVDVERAQIRWQSEWFKDFNLADVIRLASKYTVAQMLAREDFARRYAAGSPIGITELLYPLLQSYDSVAIESDVEIGGTDQLFNFLVARDIQRESGQEPQNILTTPLLVGTDGSMKMSKSVGNYIAVTDTPDDMFGKLMSIPDRLIGDYLTLLTDQPDDEIAEQLRQAESGAVNPRDIKERMALDVVTAMYSSEDAAMAKESFDRVFRERQLPEDMPEVKVPHEIGLLRLLVLAETASSNNNARQLVKQGGVQLDGVRQDDAEATVHLDKPVVLQVGRRTFRRLIPE